MSDHHQRQTYADRGGMEYEADEYGPHSPNRQPSGRPSQSHSRAHTPPPHPHHAHSHSYANTYDDAHDAAYDVPPYPFKRVSVGAPGHPLEAWALASAASAPPYSGLASSQGHGDFGRSTWDGTRPFSFARRQGRLDWETILNLDLAAIVRNRDLGVLQEHTHQLVYADITQTDVSYFEAGGRGRGSGAANALHLFRLWQLTGEALLHVQAFLLRSLQAKEGAVAREREKHIARVEAERAAATVLKARLGAAQKELKQARAAIAGYERAALARPIPAVPAAAHYPGEVYTCTICGNAFMAPHFLTQHYQRRHPGFQTAPAPQPPPSKPAVEEKEAPAYVPPPRPQLDEAAVEKMRANLRAEITASLDASWTLRRAEEHRRLLARLTSLQLSLHAQFSAQTLPAHMEPQQRRMYEALLAEVEAIKTELARNAQVEWGDMRAPQGTPTWSILQQQQQEAQVIPPPSPPPPARSPSPVPAAAAPRSPSPPPPAPLAVVAPVSPVDSNPAYTPSPRSESPPRTPPPALDPQTLEHLSRIERLRAALLARTGKEAFAPFPDLPWLHSRYALPDWNPPPMYALADVEQRADELCRVANAAMFAELEATMHAMPDAADTYNAIHAAVEERAAAHPLEDWIAKADLACDARQAFLPQWELLLLDKEARDAAKATRALEEAEAVAKKEAEETRLKREREAAEAAARTREAEERRRQQEVAAQALERERLAQEQRQQLIAYELSRSQLAQQQLAQQHQLQLQAQTQAAFVAAVSPSASSMASRTSSSMQPTPSPLSALSPGARNAVEGAPFIDTSTPSVNHSTEAPAVQQAVWPTPVSTAPMTHPPQQPYTGHQIMLPSPASVNRRPEGWHAPTPLATVMPRGREGGVVSTPQAKTPLSVFRPAGSMARMEKPELHDLAASTPSPPPAVLSQSSSFWNSASSASSSLAASGGVGGMSIMHRSTGPGRGALTHISEGGSVHDSLGRSEMASARRQSMEQEAKYGEGEADAHMESAMASVPSVPRTALDDEFEQMLSPKRVAPRTQPPWSGDRSRGGSAAASPVAGSPSSASVRFMLPSTPPAPLTVTLSRASSASTNVQQQPQWHGAPLLMTDRNQAQPGAPTPGPGWTPGAPTPAPGTTLAVPGAGGAHTYRIGGNSFTFRPSDVAALAPAPTPEQGPIGGDAYGRLTPTPSPSPMSNEQARRAATEQARKEEEEALGVTSSFARPGGMQQQQQQQPQQSPPNIPLASRHTSFPSTVAPPPAATTSHSRFNDSLDETITLEEPAPANRARMDAPVVTTTPASGSAATPAAAAGANRFLHPSSAALTTTTSRMLNPSHEQRRHEQQQQQTAQAQAQSFALPPAAAASGGGSIQPAGGRIGEPTPTASRDGGFFQPSTAVLSQPSAGAMFNQPFSAVHQQHQPQQQQPQSSFASSQGPTEVQAFTVSPSTSFMGASSSDAAPQPPSQPPPPLSVPQAQPQSFVSSFRDDDEDDEFPSDDPPASFAPAPSPMAQVSSGPPAGLRALQTAFDGGSDTESKGNSDISVIAPGSVSNRRAQLMGSGFLPMGSPMGLQGGGGVTPSMSELKAAKAAREAAEAGLSLDDIPSPSPTESELLSPTLSRAKPAAQRRARTVPAFSPRF